MSKANKASTLVIHACPENEVALANSLLEGFGLCPSWSPQNLMLGNFNTELRLALNPLQQDDLVVALNQIPGLYLDLQTPERIYMIVPGLGIYQASVNQAGEIQVSEERIRLAVEQSAGNYKELTRLLRLLLGQNWDDILEPFRAARFNSNVAVMNRAV